MSSSYLKCGDVTGEDEDKGDVVSFVGDGMSGKLLDEDREREYDGKSEGERRRLNYLSQVLKLPRLVRQLIEALV